MANGGVEGKAGLIDAEQLCSFLKSRTLRNHGHDDGRKMRTWYQFCCGGEDIKYG
jgi:hypothetical protein